MGKSLLLCLSLLGVASPSVGQVARPRLPVGDCASRPYQDSLVARYIERGAHKFSYNDPRWTKYCDSLIAICPNVALAYEQKAVPLIKDGKYAEAFALENQAVSLDPPRWLAYRGFLKCIFTKDYEGAILDFQGAARINPAGREMDHTYPFFEGVSNLELKKYTLAEANFKQDMALQKGATGKGEIHFNSFFYAGVLAFELKKYAVAKEYLQQCLHQYANHPEANYYLALVYRRLGNEQLASQHLHTAGQALAKGYRLNEDNIYYANYPRQLTAYEVQQALR
jgi:tetratricopeptide (TPR) repeat protein